MAPDTCDTKRQNKKKVIWICHLNTRTPVCVCVCVISHRGVSGYESAPEARVYRLRWSEEPAAQAQSTLSAAGSK